MRGMNSLFAMTATESQTPAFDSPAGAGRRVLRRDSFRSQTPLALLALGAVAAIVAVNRPAGITPVPSTPAIVTPTTAGNVDRRCFDCGEIVSVHLVSLHPDTAPTIKTFELNVRMDDGSRRTVRQFAPVFAVGDRVRVNGSALALRG